MNTFIEKKINELNALRKTVLLGKDIDPHYEKLPASKMNPYLREKTLIAFEGEELYSFLATAMQEAQQEERKRTLVLVEEKIIGEDEFYAWMLIKDEWVPKVCRNAFRKEQRIKLAELSQQKDL